MARRGIPKAGVSWYLVEWMAARGLQGRGAQAKMMELTGWSKATMSQLYNGTQDYSPKYIAEAAKALGIEEYELLMPPEKANNLRKLRAAAEQIVSEVPPSPPSPPAAPVESLGVAASRKRAAQKGAGRKTGTHG
jgi:transcriptional regulator with XRE-family HTH domain